MIQGSDVDSVGAGLKPVPTAICSFVSIRTAISHGTASRPPAILALSTRGGRIGERIRRALSGATLHLHEDAAGPKNARRFPRIVPLARRLFKSGAPLIFVAPCGVAVRAIAPLIKDKRADPPVVVVDAGARWVVSLLSGHEGGANGLAFQVAAILDAEPVVTTATEAEKDIVVGIGCRRGTPAETIVAAIKTALVELGLGVDAVRLVASVDLKKDEAGLIEACVRLDLPLRIVSSKEIRASTRRDYRASARVERLVGLPAVAAPAALLAGRRTELLLQRNAGRGVTIAVAREESP
jgi:cobalt-precorrin 5A hydrolase